MKRREIFKLDEQWAILVKTKAKYICEHCGVQGVRMEAAHVAGRRYRNTRWGCSFSLGYDLCGHCFCHSCHQHYDDHGPLEVMIVRDTIGKERKERIQQAAQKLVGDQQDFEDIHKILTAYSSTLGT